MEEIAEVKSVHGKLGEPVKVGSWELTVLDVKESIYVREDNDCYRAKEGYKVVI